MTNEKLITVTVKKDPSFTEVWYEGHVMFNDKKHMFWLIDPQGKDEEGREYEMELRWWFKDVPAEIRNMGFRILNDYKRTNYDTRTN